jgi:CheY-like chemotaxis protein
MAGSQTTEKPTVLTSKPILVIADSDQQLGIMDAQLIYCDAEVATVINGNFGLTRLDQYHQDECLYDIVVSERDLLGIKGQPIAGVSRAEERFKNIPLILMVPFPSRPNRRCLLHGLLGITHRIHALGAPLCCYRNSTGC